VYERTAALYSGAAPITVRALNASDGATLSGGVRVRGWALGAGGALLAPLPAGVASCTLLCERSGQCRPRARTPNEGAYFTWAAPLCANLSQPACREAARWGFVFAGSDVPAAPYDAQRVEVSVYGGWTASRHAIASIHPSNSTVLLQNPANMPIGQWRNHDSEGGGRYFLDNVREGLDAAGEFYCDIPAREVLYRPLAGEADPAALELYLAVERTVVAVANTSDVTLAGPGLVVAHAAWFCDFAAAAVCDWQSTTWQDYAAIRVTNASFVTVASVEVAGVGGAAVWFDEGTRDSAVIGSYLHDLAAGGVRVAGGFLPLRPGIPNVCQNGTVARINITDNVIGRFVRVATSRSTPATATLTNPPNPNPTARPATLNQQRRPRVSRWNGHPRGARSRRDNRAQRDRLLLVYGREPRLLLELQQPLQCRRPQRLWQRRARSWLWRAAAARRRHGLLLFSRPARQHARAPQYLPRCVRVLHRRVWYQPGSG
jgi:hypothetical protein